jgi:multimeric flavodoxin WrbA
VPEGALLYDEVRLRYESSGSIVVGYYSSGSQELVLNPVKGCWCEAGDVLVALTRTSGKA